MACVSKSTLQRPAAVRSSSPAPAEEASASIEQLAPDALQRTPSPKPLAERRAVSLGHLSTSGIRRVGETEEEEGVRVSLPSSACPPDTPEWPLSAGHLPKGGIHAAGEEGSLVSLPSSACPPDTPEFLRSVRLPDSTEGPALGAPASRLLPL